MSRKPSVPVFMHTSLWLEQQTLWLVDDVKAAAAFCCNSVSSQCGKKNQDQSTCFKCLTVATINAQLSWVIIFLNMFELKQCKKSKQWGYHDLKIKIEIHTKHVSFKKEMSKERNKLKHKPTSYIYLTLTEHQKHTTKTLTCHCVQKTLCAQLHRAQQIARHPCTHCSEPVPGLNPL